MKPGDTMDYGGRTIQRLKNRDGHRRYKIEQFLGGRKTFFSKGEAKRAIDLDNALKPSREHVEKGLPHVVARLVYEDKVVERVPDSKRGFKRYRVEKMGDFKSVDAAVARIAWSVASLGRVENPPVFDEHGMKRNCEK